MPPLFQLGVFEYSRISLGQPTPLAPLKPALSRLPISQLPPRRVFCHKNIEIHPKEFVLITGPSGGGKSTLLQLLKGIFPEFGSGHLEGQLLYKQFPLHGEYFKKNSKEILFLFQNPFSQIIFSNASEEFFFSMENFQYSREEMTRTKNHLQNHFNLQNLWHKKTHQLSNGECQRLVLSSLLAINPEVLLLDEPTAFLDPTARKDFYKWLLNHKGSQTIILVDHHLSETLPLADKILFVSAQGEISEISKERANERSNDSSNKRAHNCLLPSETLPIQAKFEKSHQINSQIHNQINAQSRIQTQLCAQNICFRFDKKTPLLENIYLQANSHDIVIVKGKNGSGKSTLFKILAGLTIPDQGTIDFFKDQVLIPTKKRYKGFGFVFQNPESHFFYDTIQEELKQISSTQTPHLQPLFDSFLKNIDLNMSPFQLSEGEKRRLSILMTALHDKQILFYDEPTFGQDPSSIETIRKLILYFKAMGKIQFIISHDESFYSTLNAKVYELDCGQLWPTMANNSQLGPTPTGEQL